FIFVPRIQSSFQPLTVTGHAERKNPERKRHEQIGLATDVAPGGIDNRGLHRAQNIEQTDNQHQRRVLEQGDQRIDDPRDHHLEGLRQNDQPHFLPVAQAQRIRSLVLPARNGLQATAYDLGHISAVKEAQTDKRSKQFVDGYTGGQEQRNHQRGHEQHGNQRHTAKPLDEQDGKAANYRHGRTTTQRQQNTQRQRHHHADI